MLTAAGRTFAADGSCRNPGARLSFRARVLIWFYRYVFKSRFPQRVDIARARDAIAGLDRWLGRFHATVRRDDVQAEGILGEWVTAAQGIGSRTILYLHGGGFMFRTPLTHAGLAARLCDALDARAFLPRYRLAPEHPLPAAHEDCFAAYRWLLASGHDPARIVVLGDSAGGTLVLAVLQRIRDAHLPAPACGVMFSPGTDFEQVLCLDAEATSGDPMIGAGVLELLQRVVIAPVDVHNPAVSPCAGSLAGLPPLLFQVGSTEVLLEQSRQAFRQVRASGGVAELQIWPEMPHVFQAVQWLPETRQALTCVREFVVRHDFVIAAGAAPVAVS
jgi:monoterpene epsilon-lactone hydrolase